MSPPCSAAGPADAVGADLADYDETALNRSRQHRLPAPDPSFGAPLASAQPFSAPADPRVAGLSAEVVDLVRRGKKIQAIKLYRELTNVDLKTAKDVIDSI